MPASDIVFAQAAEPAACGGWFETERSERRADRQRWAGAGAGGAGDSLAPVERDADGAPADRHAGAL